jgi:hypothetical protein
MHRPFPGMDPYLEHPLLWESVHARLTVAIANQLQPKLDPRYVASIEERVFIERPQRRIPDVWIQKVSDAEGMTALADPESDTALIVEVDDLEIRESPFSDQRGLICSRNDGCWRVVQTVLACCG